MHKFSYVIATLAAPLAATSLSAQAAEEAPASTESQAAAEAAADAATPTYTDAQVAQFAPALAAVDAIQLDDSIPAADKQTKMAEAVASSGLDASTFNDMVTALDTDPTLQKRVMAEINAAAEAEAETAVEAEAATDAEAAAE